MVINNKNIINCVKCGNRAHKIMVIQGRGYGSELDCITENTLLPICPKCSKVLKDEWFYEPCVIENGYCEKYPNEHKIMDFINSLPDNMRSDILQ